MFSNSFKIFDLFLGFMVLVVLLDPPISDAKKGADPSIAPKTGTVAMSSSISKYAQPPELTRADKSEVASKMAKLHMPFISNEGQMDSKVKFYAKTFRGTVFITRGGEVVYSLPKRTRDEVTAEAIALKEQFVGGTARIIRGEVQAITRVCSFKGKDRSKWRSNIPTYESVNLGEVYEGIGLKLKAYGNNVEKLFLIEPGAKPERIMVRINGAKGMKKNESGELEVETELGAVKFTRPVAYQEDAGKRTYVEVAYVVESNVYGFAVGDYDKDNVLIIDPLLASTFLGGNDGDYPEAVTLDGSGNVYVAGETLSSNFPTTSGAYDESHNGDRDAFVSKLDNNLAAGASAIPTTTEWGMISFFILLIGASVCVMNRRVRQKLI